MALNKMVSWRDRLWRGNNLSALGLDAGMCGPGIWPGKVDFLGENLTKKTREMVH